MGHVIKRISGAGKAPAPISAAASAARLVAYVTGHDGAVGSAGSLLAYVADMHGGAAGATVPHRERVLHVMTRGGLAGRNPRVWAAQFDALIRDVGGRPRADPVQHWVISFRSGEAPKTRADWERRLDDWLDLMDARGLPVVAAVHGDTDNPHCHIVLNRVDPVTREMRPVGGAWPFRRAQQVVAILDRRFRLSPERGTLRAAARQSPQPGWTGEGVCEDAGNALHREHDRFVAETGRQERARAQGRPVAPPGMTLDGAGQVARILREAASWPELGERLAACSLTPELTRGPKGGRGLRLAATDGSGGWPLFAASSLKNLSSVIGNSSSSRSSCGNSTMTTSPVAVSDAAFRGWDMLHPREHIIACTRKMYYAHGC
ncbi:relaxase/mobilization nuclease domain-containing protein [Thermaurantiacus tibetensis]|uniref:relaxase/mobilization nuclease domain-containing protein n=1 Tax=Thermaurantiacus tibetensis TaxID=2759035 RepID=UPI00188F4F1A|nr:relaxase/mobilization nuclease domain-containing protein [Thermaurantiacus tibetensis]